MYKILNCTKLQLKTFACIAKTKRTLATSSSLQLDVSGVFPPLTTPFNQQGEIEFKKIKENVEKFNSIPFKGYAVHGSNGEYVYLSDREKIKILAQVKESAKDGKVIVAGTGCESTYATIETTKAMAKYADAAMVVTPSYYKPQMNASALLAHYTEVADNSPIPILLYSVPGYTTIDIPLDVIEKLSHHENIIGIKESSGNISKIGEMVLRTQSTKDGFQILAGSASFFLPTLLIGGVGSVCALANVLGNEVCQLYDLFKENDIKKAVELQRRLIPPNMAVTSQFGVAGLKKIMDKLGYTGGHTRSPLQPLDDTNTDKLYRIFSSFK